MDEKESKENKVTHIKDWPESDHPREMLLEKGSEALSDAALLAIILGTGRRGKSAVALAREMLASVGGFRGLMSMTQEDFSKMKGMGKAKIAQIMAAMEIVKRQLRQPLEQSNVIRNTDDLFEYLKKTTGNLSGDKFRVLHLSRSQHLIADEVIFKGTADSASAIPRNIVENAVKKKAAAVVMVRHHPIDLPMASDEDVELTKALVKACWVADITVMDHIIIGKNGFLSMKRHLPEIFEGEDEIA